MPRYLLVTILGGVGPPFTDGNKRIGTALLFLLYLRQGNPLDITENLNPQ